MPSWTSAPLALLVLAAIAAPAVADDCVEPAVARSTGGRPCGDLSASMGRAELWRAPGFTDLRVSVLRIGFYDNDAARRATSFELGSWEAIGDDDGLQRRPSSARAWRCTSSRCDGKSIATPGAPTSRPIC